MNKNNIICPCGLFIQSESYVFLFCCLSTICLGHYEKTKACCQGSGKHVVCCHCYWWPVTSGQQWDHGTLICFPHPHTRAQIVFCNVTHTPIVGHRGGMGTKRWQNDQSSHQWYKVTKCSYSRWRSSERLSSWISSHFGHVALPDRWSCRLTGLILRRSFF